MRTAHKIVKGLERHFNEGEIPRFKEQAHCQFNNIAHQYL